MGAALFGRLCRSIRGTTAVILGVGAFALWIALLAGALTALAWDDLEGLSAPRLIASLDAGLSEARMNELYLETRAWEEVRGALFRFDGSAFEGARALNVPSTPAIQLTLAPAADVTELRERAGLLEGVSGVYVSRAERVDTLLNGSPTLKPILLTAFVVTLVAGLLALRAGVGRLARGWRGELEILRLSGVSRRSVAPSFALVGLLMAAVGAVLAAATLYGALIWARTNPALVRGYLPLLLESERVTPLALEALIVGVLAGLIAGMWGARAVRRP